MNPTTVQNTPFPMKCRHSLLKCALPILAICFPQILHAGADLPVPYYWQADAGWCWAASASMLARYYTHNQPTGYQAKPWNAAAILHKGHDDGGSADDILALLGAFAPAKSFGVQEHVFDFWIKHTIMSKLDQGHPVICGTRTNVFISNTSLHVFVVTGYSGPNDNDYVFINDPSGDLFKQTFGLCHVPVTWSSFTSLLYASFPLAYGDLYLISENSTTGAPAGGQASIDLCPSHIIPTSDTTWKYVQFPSIIARQPCNSSAAFLTWGRDVSWNPYGYSLTEGTLSLRGGAGSGGSARGVYLLNTDSLTIEPFITSHSATALECDIQLQIASGGSLIYTNKTTRSLDSYVHLYDDPLFTIPLLPLRNKFTDNTFALTLILNTRVQGSGGAFLESDRVTLQIPFRPLDPAPLSGGSVNPQQPTAGDSCTFTVRYCSPLNSAPAGVQLVLDGVSRAMSTSGSNWLNGQIFTVSSNIAAVGSHSFHFSVDLGCGVQYRLPEIGEYGFNVTQPSQDVAGWDVGVTSLSVSSSRIKPGQSITVTGSVYNNSTAGNTYAALGWQLQLIAPSGTIESSRTGTFAPITVPNSASIPAQNFTPSSQGSYQVVFTVFPDRDTNAANNTLSSVVLVSDQASTKQYYFTGGNSFVQWSTVGSSRTVGGVTYTLNTLGGSSVILNINGSGYTLSQGDYKVTGSGIVFVELISNVNTNYVTLSFGTEQPDYLLFDQVDIAAYRGERVTFPVHCTGPSSGNSFNGTQPDFYGSAATQAGNWYNYNFTPSDGVRDGAYVFDLAVSSSPGINNFGVKSRLTDGQFMRNLTIRVVARPPAITNLSSCSLVVGQAVSVYGSNLLTSGTLLLADRVVSTTSWADKQIQFVVPSGVTNGLLRVTNSYGSSGGLAYTVVQSPNLVLTPASTNSAFGSIQAASTSSWQVVTISNVGNVSSLLNVQSWQSPTTEFFAELYDSSGNLISAPSFTIATQSFITAKCQYRPTTLGGKTNNFVLTHNGSSYVPSPLAFRVTGTGIDTTPPVLRITIPTTNGIHTNPLPFVTIGGTLTDNHQLASIRWSSSTGGGDTNSTPSSPWSFVSLPLFQGSNAFTVVAKDFTGNAATNKITIKFALPTNTISSPTAGQRWSNEVFGVSGTAKHDFRIAALWCQTLGSDWISATTTNGFTNWFANVPLIPGTNQIRAFAVDEYGNRSTTNSVAFQYVVTNQLQLSTTGLGTFNPNYSNAWLEIGRNYSITSAPASGFRFTNWTSSQGWTSIAAAVTFMMQSNLALTANFVDTNKPTVSITNLVANQRVSNGVYTVMGTATDNWQVGAVMGQLNSAAWIAAAGTNGWSFPATLTPGTNIFAVYAVDTSGNYSSTNSVAFQYVVTNQLQLSTTGLGTFNPNYSNAWLEIGRNYSITSAPASGFRFTNWTSSQGWTSISAAVTFIMQSNLALTANFVDTNKPTVSITNLVANQRVSNGVYTVMGTATDNWQVGAVMGQLNNEAWVAAAGTNGWSLPATLTPGTNIFAVYAVDTSGNYSSTSSVAFQYVVTNQLQLSTAGLGTFNPNYSNAWLEIGRNYSITSAPASGFRFTNWTSSQGWTSIAAAVTFMMQSNLALTANFVDTNKPTVSITNLVANQRVSNGVYTVMGTATDNWQVGAVMGQLNSGAWIAATGTNGWSFPATLAPGTNVFAVYAVDTSGNGSTTNSVAFQYVVTNQLQLSTTGLGTFNPNYSNAWLEIGRNYSITSAPAAGFRFTNWTSSQGWTSISAAVTFMMQSNLALTANFVDTNKPTVSITNLVANQRVSNGVYTVMGTATDNWQVGAVMGQLNNGAWVAAAGTNGWSFPATLTPGTNIFAVYAVDTSGNGSTTNSVTFQCMVTNAPATKAISVAGNLAFGSVGVGSSSNSTFQITNTGTAPLTVSSILYSNTAFSGLCNGTIPVGSYTNVTVTFRPTGASNYSSGLVVFSDATSGVSNLMVSGTGIAPEIDFYGSGQPIASDGAATTVNGTDFGSTLTNSAAIQRSFIISNAGSAALNLTGNPLVARVGANASEFTVGPLSTNSVQPGGQVNFTVSFVPTNSGLRIATLYVTNNDGNENPYIIAIQGTGTNATGSSFLTNGLVAYYPLDTNCNDASTNANNGTGYGVVYTNGYVGSGMAWFDGNNHYISIPRSIGAGDFTIAHWIKTTNVGGTGAWWDGKGLVNGEVLGSQGDFGTSLLGGQVGFGYGNTTLLSSNSVNNGSWHHVVATVVSSTGLMKVYIDGNIDASTSGPPGSKTDPANLTIGCIRRGVGFLVGSIDEVRLYNRALSEQEVTGLFWANAAGDFVKFVANSLIRTNSQMSIALQGPPNARYEVSASTNLAGTNWTVVTVGTNLTGTATFSEPTTNLNRRFFRFRFLP